MALHIQHLNDADAEYKYIDDQTNSDLVTGILVLTLIHNVYLVFEAYAKTSSFYNWCLKSQENCSFSSSLVILATGLKKYFKDFWNCVDMLASVLTLIYLSMYENNSAPEDQRWVLSAANLFIWIRLMSWFRLYSPTRYLINMILDVLQAIKPFMLIFSTFILAISVNFMALRTEDNDKFADHLQLAYRLAFGDFEPSYDTTPDRIIFVLASFFLPLLMMNLLIAILSDQFDKVENKRSMEETEAKIDLILEVAQFSRLFRQTSKLYIHYCTTE